MEQALLDKLVTEVRRYQSKDFLKAAMAVCALAANADDEVNLAERYRIDRILAKEPALQLFDAGKAIEILDRFLFDLRQEGEVAKRILDSKIRRMAGDTKKSRTLLRIAYLIIVADQEIRIQEKQEFARLCAVLNFEPAQIWRELAG